MPSQQLVEEKRRLLEAAAPRVSLQDYIQGGPDVLQQNVEIMRDAVAAPAVAAPAVAWGEASKELGQNYLHAGLTPREKAVLQEQADLRAAMAVAVAVQEGASWVAESQPAEWATGAGLPHEPPAQGDEEPSAEPQEPGAAPEPPPEPREACAASERSACSGSQAPLLHRSSEAAQQRAARLQQELYLREMRECTFRPRINRRGGAPAPHGATEDFVERAQRWREEREREQEERRRQKEQAVTEECPFRPSLASIPTWRMAIAILQGLRPPREAERSGARSVREGGCGWPALGLDLRGVWNTFAVQMRGCLSAMLTVRSYEPPSATTPTCRSSSAARRRCDTPLPQRSSSMAIPSTLHP